MKNAKHYITAERFCEIWQTSGSCKEVAEKCGMTTGGVSARAQYLRNKKGVPLKHFCKVRGGPVNAAACIAIAKKFAPKD